MRPVTGGDFCGSKRDEELRRDSLDGDDSSWFQRLVKFDAIKKSKVCE